MSVLMMKMPPRVTTSIDEQEAASCPSSPPIVPGSSVRSRPSRSSVGKSRSSLPRWVTITMSATVR